MKKTGNNIFRTLRVFFGLFMVIVYLGMAYLMFINFFDWNTSLTFYFIYLFLSFILFVFYRCYRHITGVDYYLTRRDDDDEDSLNSLFHFLYD